jgi:hypothetical protein
MPQCEQNFAPRNIIPKHAGHATVASRELQCSQRVASEAAAAPQLGQFNDCAAMRKKLSARPTFRKRRLRPPDYTIHPKLCFTALRAVTMIRPQTER